MWRIIFALFIAVAAAPALAQNQYTTSPLTCFEVEGVAIIAQRMSDPAQIGALGNPPSHTVWRESGQTKKAGCSYNYGAGLVAADVVWLQVPRWLIKLEVRDVGNNIWMWRPAEIYDRRRHRLPRRCERHFFTEQVQGVSPRRYLISLRLPRLPWDCLQPQHY